MDIDNFRHITGSYAGMSVAVLGDFCLDRYLEIDPDRSESSIETGLPVHNVMKVRSQPGGAGTILNNLVALGIGNIYPIGFAGWDGEGFELWNALEKLAGVRLSHFVRTMDRSTFTYCKPLLVRAGQPPVELNRLDTKNWTPTPGLVQGLVINHLMDVAVKAQAIIVLDQVDIPETGVVTQRVLQALKEIGVQRPGLIVVADSRRGLRGFPPVVFKMNAAELAALTASTRELSLEEIKEKAVALSAAQGRHVLVTLAERGMVGATPGGQVEHIPSLPLRGPIDIVGAGDAVTANFAAALVADASLREALELASAAASVVIHKLGTTGTANLSEIEPLVAT